MGMLSICTTTLQKDVFIYLTFQKMHGIKKGLDTLTDVVDFAIESAL